MRLIFQEKTSHCILYQSLRRSKSQNHILQKVIVLIKSNKDFQINLIYQNQQSDCFNQDQQSYCFK